MKIVFINRFFHPILALAGMLKRDDIVVAKTDPPHMRRLSWVWARVFEGSGKEYLLVASDTEVWDAEHWWRSSLNAQFAFSEYIKLAYYMVQY